MIILALDSAISSCSAAVIKDGEIIFELFEDRMRGHAERLVPMCQEVCDHSGLSFGDLEYIAVTRGPGTFTGVRIGLATAKGLSLALNVPLIGVTTLETVAKNAAEYLDKAFRGRVAIALDARRSEVYMQFFEINDNMAVPANKPMAIPLSDCKDYVGADIKVMIGTGCELVKPFLPKDILAKMAFPQVQSQPNAGTIGRIAGEKLASGVDIIPISPLYLRAPDAIAAKPIVYPFQNL